MFMSLWQLATHAFSLSNPAPAELADYWIAAEEGLRAATILWIAAIATAAAGGWGLVGIASRKGTAPLTKSFKVVTWLLTALNVLFIWFGPSFAADARIFATLKAQGKSTEMQGTFSKVWDSSSSSSHRRRTRYFASIEGIAASDKHPTYQVSYDTYAAAKMESRVDLRCYATGSCWIAGDFTEIQNFCLSALIAASANLLFAAAAFYLIQQWRIEPQTPGAPR